VRCWIGRAIARLVLRRRMALRHIRLDSELPELLPQAFTHLALINAAITLDKALDGASHNHLALAS